MIRWILTTFLFSKSAGNPHKYWEKPDHFLTTFCVKFWCFLVFSGAFSIFSGKRKNAGNPHKYWISGTFQASSRPDLNRRPTHYEAVRNVGFPGFFQYFDHFLTTFFYLITIKDCGFPRPAAGVLLFSECQIVL